MRNYIFVARLVSYRAINIMQDIDKYVTGDYYYYDQNC